MEIRQHQAEGVRSEALFSRCGGYRYALRRDWGAGPCAGFVMLNPSKADERANDPTIERCQRRATAMGAGGFVVVNLFGWRATRPQDLKAALDPVGPDNDMILLEYLRGCQPVICAWGFHGAHLGRAAHVTAMLRDAGVALHHLGLTRQGQPRHPLYLPYSAQPEPWR
ncbi:MAG: DUF1643 domain-containing protein [Paracoccus sp. (in: a-proteobacteria)]|nr:DUF1643 domain-containing protein [Paracoccus sp. (in: a-proteobacteria)]